MWSVLRAVFTGLSLVLTLWEQALAYEFNTVANSLGAWVDAYGYYDYHFASGDDWDEQQERTDLWHPGSYHWGTPLSETIPAMSGISPAFSSSASGTVSSTGPSQVALASEAQVQAAVTGMAASEYFGVQARTDVEVYGKFSIAAGADEAEQTLTTFDLSLEGLQSASGDFASWAHAFFGIYDGSARWGWWNGYDDPKLLGYYEYANGDFHYRDDRSYRVRNGSHEEDSQPTLTITLETGRTYSFWMWLLLQPYGSDNYPYWGGPPGWNWESYDGFVLDGNCDGNASAMFGTTFEWIGVDIQGASESRADFDGDGDVDGDDFLAWQASFGTDNGGDADGDADTDGDDFLIWQSEFGSGSGAASAAVPEPSCMALVLVMAAVGTVFRRTGFGRRVR